MRYDSSICSSCRCYGNFGRCQDKGNQKCKDCYEKCIAYQRKYAEKNKKK